MFKEPEPGNKDINIERTDEALDTGADIIAAACPFCNTMMSDGIKAAEKEGKIEVLDIAEMIASAEDL
ncbi:iron-sulphur-binding reductase [Nonlabens ulvanivorans]|nr:iron-sulphur-binding reductase [Nonlabens ulvanivorans]